MKKRDGLVPLFVYGTLRAGHPNSALNGLEGTFEVDRNVRLNGYQIFDLGWFPGIVEGKGSIIGDVFWVNEGAFPRLDAYEGAPNLYLRQTVTIGGIAGVQVYRYNGNVDGRTQIEDGDWLKWRAQAHGN